MAIKNPVVINYQREKVLAQAATVQNLLNRIKSDLASEVKEDDTCVSHANLEWWLASSSELTKEIAAYDVAVAQGV